MYFLAGRQPFLLYDFHHHVINMNILHLYSLETLQKQPKDKLAASVAVGGTVSRENISS